MSDAINTPQRVTIKITRDRLREAERARVYRALGRANKIERKRDFLRKRMGFRPRRR